MIIEEYKELSKVAVLEERERAHQELGVALKEEAEKCGKLLIEQKDRLSDMLRAEQEESKEKIQSAVESLREETKAIGLAD